MKMMCSACGEKSLLAVRGRVEVEYKGNKGSIVELSHTCEECGALLFLEPDVRENKRAWNRFKKQFDLVPLGCEIKAMRIRAGLSQREAGNIFGGGPVAFSKYESDDLIPDEGMVNLLRMAIAYPDTVFRLIEVKSQHVRINTLVTATEGAECSDWERSPGSSFTELKVDELQTVSLVSIKVKAQSQENVWVQ